MALLATTTGMADGPDGIDVDPVGCPREAMSRAMRLISPSVAGVSPMQQLLSVSAEWRVLPGIAPARDAPVPKLRSMRRRGVAPAYPHASLFEGMEAGTIVLYPNGFVLEPRDRRHPCLNVADSMVEAAVFYRDAFEVRTGPRERVLVRTDPVDHIDSIFQAYFWNPVP